MFCGSPWAIPSPQHPCTSAPSLLLAPSALGFVGRRGRGMLGDQSLPLAMIATIVSDLLVGKDTTSLSWDTWDPWLTLHQQMPCCREKWGLRAGPTLPTKTHYLTPKSWFLPVSWWTVHSPHIPGLMWHWKKTLLLSSSHFCTSGFLHSLTTVRSHHVINQRLACDFQTSSIPSFLRSSCVDYHPHRCWFSQHPGSSVPGVPSCQWSSPSLHSSHPLPCAALDFVICYCSAFKKTVSNIPPSTCSSSSSFPAQLFPSDHGVTESDMT